MTLGQRLAFVVVLGVIGGALVLGGARPASAQAALPYVAYGAGLVDGQIVEAFVGTTSLGRTTVDRLGHWRLQIEPGTAANGDRVTFAVDDKPSSVSVTFQSGRFLLPPGIQLGAAPAPAVHPTPSPSARPSATPTATPTRTPLCTSHGKRIACAAPTARTGTAR